MTVLVKYRSLIGLCAVIRYTDTIDTCLVVVDGGRLLDVMPSEAVSVEDEEDLPPLAEEAGGLVPDDA